MKSSLRCILYILFVLFWFKDNFSPLRKIPLSHLFALIPLLILTLGLCIMKFHGNKMRLPKKVSRETAALLALLLLTVILRIPCLLFPSGMMNSDDAVMALMGKHISEGKVPPVCFYGQLYMGSLSSHFFALMYAIFGYSMFVLKCATLLIYLSFMAVQFYFLKEIFSFSFSCAIALFYSLPLPHLNIAAFDNTSAYQLVFLLGSLLLYLTYLISFRGKEKWLPALGFLMGLSFWTHQITAGFILTSLLLLLLKTTFRIKKYATLFFYGLLGFLPQLLVEIFSRFQLITFLAGEKSIVDLKKARWTLLLTESLFPVDASPLDFVLLFLIFSGFIYLILFSWKKRTFLPSNIFPLSFLVFYLLYFFSGFSNKHHIRYLYPAYLFLPVLVVAPFLAFRLKLRKALPFALVALLFFLPGLKGTLVQYKEIKSRYLHISRTLKVMEKTGRRYWFGEYWTSYLLTAISKENIIVVPLSFDRYLPYVLACWNQKDQGNYVFLYYKEQAESSNYRKFVSWLETSKLRAKRIDIGKGRIFYDVGSRINPWAIFMGAPSLLPRLELERISPSHGYLRLTFINKSVGQDLGGFCLRAEIPGFSSSEKCFSLADKEVQIDLPYPPRGSFPIRYVFKYLGVKIQSSAQDCLYSFPRGETQQRNDVVVFLKGFGPSVEYQGENRRVCAREVSLELNRLPSEDLTMRFYLESPFQFSSWRWYGKFSQSVRIEVNGLFLQEKELQDGTNIICLVIPKKTLKQTGNTVSMKFRYQLWFKTDPLWKTGEIAALLNKIEINRPGAPPVRFYSSD